MNTMEVIQFEDELRKIEHDLEALGQKICNMHGSCGSWNAINSAIVNVQDAIHDAYMLDDGKL